MQIQFCNHPHPLVPCELENKLYCKVCIQAITQRPVYGCNTCKYFFHKSCAELQQHLQHPFHPKHPLILRPNSSVEDWCAACGKSFIGGCSTYYCKECNFNLCIDCIPAMPDMKWDGHVHPLAFVKAYHGCTYCGFCGSHCWSGESVLHCLPCDFTVHPRCIAELPQSIEVRHIHPLFLNESPIEDSTEELYCQVCEKLRSPNQTVYSCKECDYVAELYCGILGRLPNIIINNKEVEKKYDPALHQIDKQISTLRDHSMDLAKKLEDLNIKAKEFNQAIEEANKEVKMLEEERTRRASSGMLRKD